MNTGFQPFRSKESRDKFLANIESLEKTWPIAFESRMVPTTYGETYVRISGPEDAPPMVLLPGGYSNSLTWRRLIDPLSVRYRTYALDAVYDQGRSLPIQPMKTIDELRQWLDDVLDGLGLEQGITLAGQSFGCYASAEYALHAQERVNKLIWIAPVMIGAPISQEWNDQSMPAADGKRESLEAFCRWVLPYIAANQPGEFEQRIDEMLQVGECYAEMSIPFRAAVMSDDDLQRISIPTLYVLGEKDGATDDAGKALARVSSLMPHVETMLVPGAAHDIVASDTELLIERLLNFI